MVALDGAVRTPSPIKFNLSAVLVGGGLLGGLCAAGLPLALLGRTYEGWLLAARTTDEFAGLLFLIAFLAGPFARLFPKSFATALKPDRRRLALGFVAAYSIYLCVAFLAADAETQTLGAQQAFAMAFQFCVLAVMAATSNIRSGAAHVLQHRIHNAALWFFWLAYTFSYVSHFVGPHIPDASYGVGLILMI